LFIREMNNSTNPLQIGWAGALRRSFYGVPGLNPTCRSRS